MNPQLADLADLREWADRLGSRSQLPILLRRLLLASSGADVLRAPGGDAVGEYGWDITLDLPDAVPPFAPRGSSRWEGGVGADPRKKAQSDFKKRTDATPAAVRATQTFVFFTPRHFEDSDDWIQAKRKEGHGWADIKVVDGVIIEEWLESRPDVHIWFSELIGKTPADVRPLDTWWDRWSTATSPALPAGVLTAGRRERAQDLRARLRSSAGVVSVVADTSEEALAFVAACLHDGPAPAMTDEAGTAATSESVDGVIDDGGTPSEDAADGSGEATVVAVPTAGSGIGGQAGVPEVEPLPQRAALLARAVIVDSPAAWARLAHGTTPLILIPTFMDPDVGSAVAAGHHVVVPAVSRHADDPLPRIRIDEAAEAFRSVDVEFARSYEYARSARRSLSGLRRRLANSGLLRDPEWASGTAPSTLGPLLLLGGWREDHAADIELIEDLTETKWRKLARDLQTVTRMPDPPVRVEAKGWDFLDPTDAWHMLADAITSVDLEIFHERLVEVVAEPDPILALPEDEQANASIRGLKRRYSPAIRQGMATTLAVLGAVVGDRDLQDGSTGSHHATQGVRNLLDRDDPAHWVNLAPLLPILAEAAPDAFLVAVEHAAAAIGSPLRALFEEGPPTPVGRRDPVHHHLLWALERLTFSDQYVSRASLVLAQLAEIDPGGRSMSRPEASLVDALDLIAPQGAVTDQSRGIILDLLQANSSDVAWNVMTDLVENTAGRTVFPASTPQWRDWTQPDTTRRISRVYADLVDVLDRLTTIVHDEPARAKDLVALLPHPLRQERQALLDAILTAAAALDDADRREIAEKLADFATRYRQLSRRAGRGITEDEIEAVAQAATSLASDVFTVPDVDWFSYWPRPADDIVDDTDIDKLIDEKRTAAIGAAFDHAGLAAAVELADASEAAEIVGTYLARHTDVSDAGVLALNASIDNLGSKITLLVLGWAGERYRADGLEWLTAALDSIDDDQLAAVLLRSAPPTPEVLQLMDAQSEGVQAAYWRHPLRGGIPDKSVREYARRLLDRDLAWSALVVLINHARKKSDRASDDAELELQALEAVRRSSEDPRGVFDHHQYGLGQLLDQLAQQGVNQTRLAQIEYWFLPVLEHARNPIALYGELERDPKVFASIVIGSYRRESEDLEEPDGDTEDAPVDEADVHAGEGDGQDPATLGPIVAEAAADEAAVGFASADLLDDAFARKLWARHGWFLLHEWRGLPGQISKHDVDFDQLKAWVESVLTIVDGHDRPTTGRQQVGQVLSSPVTDVDGTWPCRAVRDLLEQLQDPMIERGLLLGRFNQRGVTVRSPYDGGAQERTLAEKYRAQADAVRHAWPRSGALLDDLAKGYEDDARREDRQVGE